MLQIQQIECSLDQSISDLPALIASKLKINQADVLSVDIVKESLDARKDLVRKYTCNITVKNEKAVLKKHFKFVSAIEPEKPYEFECTKTFTERPIVIGFGPAGMFAALLMAEKGLKPIVFERGKCVDERIKDVVHFWKTGELNEQSNVQFGEGGAGTFSDGKLTTRVKDKRIQYVMDKLVEHGADSSIKWHTHAHIGTDKLRGIVKNIRNHIIELGGEVHFESQIEKLCIENGQIKGVYLHDTFYPSHHVFCAIGHSACDTFEQFHTQNIQMESKEFAVGVRVEHPQSLINECQYGRYADHPSLPAAEYRLAHQCTTGRGVYTFCMCPGGFVVPSSSHHGKLVVNGMSESGRNQTNANSALLVQVKKEDFGNELFDGLRYIEQLERKAFVMGGSNYRAPMQNGEDFLNNTVSTRYKNVLPSYALKGTFAQLSDLFDPVITESLKEGLLAFDRKLPGFKDGLLTAVESRSSSPLRIVRDETYQSISVKGFYPIGEGAGYAGGITSSALDGLRAVEACMKL